MVAGSVGPPNPGSPLPARFVDVERIGGRAGTDVYRAHDRVLDRPVAVKVFPADADPVARHRADREGRAMARLSHPGLVSIFERGTHGGRPYLVMRLVTGPSLQHLVSTGPLDMRTAVRVTADVAEALAHVHRHGVVHRDVKPSNIFVAVDGTAYLGDFGIALLVGQDRLTSEHEIIGTPAYLAPEQVHGAAVGPPADIYALGLVLLECLTGRVEYAAESRAEAALARLSRPPRIPAGIPAPVAAVLRAMTHDVPGLRPTAARCAQTLRDLDVEAEPGATDQAAPDQGVTDQAATHRLGTGAGRVRGSARRRSVALVAAAVACTAVAAGLVLAMQPDRTDGHPADGAGGAPVGVPPARSVPVITGPAGALGPVSTTGPATPAGTSPDSVRQRGAPVVSVTLAGTSSATSPGGTTSAVPGPVPLLPVLPRPTTPPVTRASAPDGVAPAG